MRLCGAAREHQHRFHNCFESHFPTTRLCPPQMIEQSAISLPRIKKQFRVGTNWRTGPPGFAVNLRLTPEVERKNLLWCPIE
jgi:hypothetical protein